MKKILLLAMFFVCISVIANADAFTTFATRADQNPTDIIDWSQLGPAFTSLSAPVSFTSFNGLNGTITTPNSLERVDQNVGNTNLGWNGNFDSGENLIWQLGNGNLTINFASGVSTVGFAIQGDAFGAYTASISVFVGGVDAFDYTVSGVSNSNQDGSAAFIGVGDLNGNHITSIVISAVDFNGNNDFAIDDVSLGTTPEPTSIALLGAGSLGVAGFMRRRLTKT